MKPVKAVEQLSQSQQASHEETKVLKERHIDENSELKYATLSNAIQQALLRPVLSSQTNSSQAKLRSYTNSTLKGYQSQRVGAAPQKAMKRPNTAQLSPSKEEVKVD